MIYIAELTLQGADELADELLIQANSEAEARNVAIAYGANWGLSLFSLQLATDRQIRWHRLRVLAEPSEAVTHQLPIDVSSS